MDRVLKFAALDSIVRGDIGEIGTGNWLALYISCMDGVASRLAVTVRGHRWMPRGPVACLADSTRDKLSLGNGPACSGLTDHKRLAGKRC